VDKRNRDGMAAAVAVQRAGGKGTDSGG